MGDRRAEVPLTRSEDGRPESFSDPSGLGWGLRCHLSDELPGGAHAAGLSIKVLQDTAGWGKLPGILCFAFPSSPTLAHSAAELAHLSSLKGSTTPCGLSLLVLITLYT